MNKIIVHLLRPFTARGARSPLFLAFAVAATLSTAAFAAQKTETLKVSGWHCGGCAARTESALKDLKGVSTASADKHKKEVTVTYDDAKVKRADLEKAVADSGFTLEK
jgi:copper chaperone CopZ